jgi:outer membrane biosynthesis protein TonB
MDEYDKIYGESHIKQRTVRNKPQKTRTVQKKSKTLPAPQKTVAPRKIQSRVLSQRTQEKVTVQSEPQNTRTVQKEPPETLPAPQKTVAPRKIQSRVLSQRTQEKVLNELPPEIIDYIGQFIKPIYLRRSLRLQRKPPWSL